MSKKAVYSDQTISVSMPAPLLLDVEQTRNRLMRKRERTFLSRSALFREALVLWLDAMKDADNANAAGQGH